MVLPLRYIGALLNLRWLSDHARFLFCRAIEDTIIGRKSGTDRTTKARRQRIEIDKRQRAHRKAQKRTGDALLKRVEQVIETGKALVMEAKGLGRRPDRLNVEGVAVMRGQRHPSIAFRVPWGA
jgi:predicted kinase